VIGSLQHDPGNGGIVHVNVYSYEAVTEDAC
jgi:hypothetical protein